MSKINIGFKFSDYLKEGIHNKKTILKVLGLIFKLLVLCAVGYIIIYPLLQMIVISIKDKAAFLNASKVWLPSSFNIKFNYTSALKAINYFDGLKSTLIYQIVACIIEVITCSITAYGFARFKFKYKTFFTVCLFVTILIPEMMIIIPRIVNYANLDFMGIFGLVYKIFGVDLRPNIVGQVWAFWLPSMFANGLRSGILIYIYIQFFKSFPYEIEEAAWIDGAGPLKTFMYIVVPSSGVVYTTVIIFSAIWHWNDTLLSSMYLFEDFPLAVNLQIIDTTLNSMGYFLTQNIEAQGILMASCMLFLLPPLIFYMIFQRRFIESIDRVGITG